MIKKREFSLLFLTFALFAFVSCEEKEEVEEGINVEFTLPSYIQTALGGTYTFTVNNGNAPLSTDTFSLTSSDGLNYACTIMETSSSHFTVQFPVSVTTGNYSVYIKRNDNRKSFGSTYIDIVEDVGGSELNDDTTIYGYVTTPDGPLAGVIVSDGVEVTVTDEDGLYQIDSDKELGYVVMTVPSGYEVGSNGVLPLHYGLLKADKNTCERCDFSLTPKAQDKFTIFMLGDMHMTTDNNGIPQFRCFATDLNSYIAAHTGETMYAVTLGDMTWDYYWYGAYWSDKFTFDRYLEEVNTDFQNLQFFHTMGNHDNDYLAYNDYDAEKPYIQAIAPTFYSYNIGKVHFVVLDDIDCTNYDGTLNRSYTCSFSTKQLNWLRKDLSYVSTDTPIILTTHATICWPSGATGFGLESSGTRGTNSNTLLNMLSPYKEVHIVDGHTHELFNVTPQDNIMSGTNIYEHNAGSICCTWWRSGYMNRGIHVSVDGSPGGYGIWEIDGTDISYQYKSFGYDMNYQWRSYDLNNVGFSMDDVSKMNQSNSTLVNAWNKYVTAYPKGSTNNQVLLNIWNWDRNWTLKIVDDNGTEYEWKQETDYDPLHILGYSLPKFNDSSISSVPSNVSENWPHFFRVTLPDANTNITITATDSFGNVYTEYMERPKDFTLDNYKNENLVY